MKIQLPKEKAFSICTTLLVLLSLNTPLYSQLSQTIKGRIVDQQSKIALIGANVIIDGTLKGSTTDIDGYFTIRNVPLGRHTLNISYLGYKTRVIPGILVNSAKEVVINIEMKEEIIVGKEVTVSPGTEKGKPENPLSTVSARSFTVEETNRYAGGFDDPARLVSGFAGVTYGNAQDNAIIIRGNAPGGLLWRLEGVEIPNPNHFPGGNVLGGGLFTIFSSNLLSRSDFLTGAFPAEYGNVTSGVFDMKFRNGNRDRREYTFQAGLIGIDFSTEGPIRKGSKASYLMNYRYSTLGLLSDLNALDTDQEIRYQDLSFKINVPTKYSGTFSFWGVGALDRLIQPAISDPDLWFENYDRLQFSADFRTSATGITYKQVLNPNAFLNTTVAYTIKETDYDQDRLDDELVFHNNEYTSEANHKITFTSTLNYKHSPRLSSTSGIIIDHLIYDLDLRSTADQIPSTYQSYVDEHGSSQVIHGFSQARYSFTQNLSVNAGLRYQYFTLNSNSSLEPRAGISWHASHQHELNFGYGRHSKREELPYYLATQNIGAQSLQLNKDMDFTKSEHWVLNYSYRITKNTLLKIEPYYQVLSDVPVIADSSFSMINLKDERYINDQLINEGRGRNYGIDLSFEKFLSQDYYYLISASLFQSKYIGGDNVERDTRYNRHYVLNMLGGKEFRVKENNILSLNIRLTMMGAERISPVLMQRSLDARQVYLDENRAYEERLTPNRFLDLTLNYRINHSGSSHVLSLMVKNLLGSENDYGYIYSYQSDSVIRHREAIVLPNISYRIEF